jgi:hypothetical protein
LIGSSCSLPVFGACLLLRLTIGRLALSKQLCGIRPSASFFGQLAGLAGR